MNVSSDEHVSNSLHHLLGEMQRIDILIQRNVRKVGQSQKSDDRFRGLYISEQDVEALMKKPIGHPPWKDKFDELTVQGSLNDLENTPSGLRHHRAESVDKGATLRLDKLANRFNLSVLDIDILLLCMAPELDLKYERIYAYLQDDLTKRRPSVDLVLNLICISAESKFVARQRLKPSAPLLRNQLLQLIDDPSHQNPPLLGKYIKVDDRVVSYLLDCDDLDERIKTYCKYIGPKAKIRDLKMPDEIKNRLTLLVQEKGVGERALILYLQGPYGVGKQTLSESLCAEKNIAMLLVDGERLINSDEIEFRSYLRIIIRESIFNDSAIYWASFDIILADDKRSLLKTLLQELENYRGLIILAGNTTWEPSDELHSTSFVRLELPLPKHTERLQIWESSLRRSAHCISDLDLYSLSNKFRFSGGQISDVIATAGNLARWRDPDNAKIVMNDLSRACRLQSNRRLETLAQKILSHHKWDEIILPPDRHQQLQEIFNHLKYRSTVYDEWGFDRKLSLGKGLNILFAGPSGTGKTMAAEIIAGELELDLYKIDLSTVVSKYIGETEKNLARIFAEAETSNAILFFDEADALFGRRSEVRDAHDRYANIEISYLLQKMEEYEGVVILATNFRKNMDDAFIRRMHFTVEFPFPNERDRRQIWERIWPAETPRSNDLDFKLLASRFEVAGGIIRNIALASAFLAAGDGGAVNMQHISHAARREFQKMGKVIKDDEFRSYTKS